MSILISSLPSVGAIQTTDLLCLARPSLDNFKVTTSALATYLAGLISGAVGSVSNSDSTLIVSPTTGSVIASLNLGHANTWSAKQTFSSLQMTTSPTNGYVLTCDSSGNASWAASGVGTVSSVANSDSSLVVFPTSGAVIASLNLNHANTWTATQSFPVASIPFASLVGTDITSVGTVTAGTWNATTIAIANGGTGQTTAVNAINAILPLQTSNSGKFLTTNGSVASWGTVAGSGTVISVATNSTLTGGTITTSGTLALNLANANTWTAGQSFTNAQTSFTPTQTIASGGSATWDGVTIPSTTVAVSGSTNITTAGGFNLCTIVRPIYSAASVLTVTNAATFTITDVPFAGGAGPIAITNAYSLWVQNGLTRFPSTVVIGQAQTSGGSAISATLPVDSTTGASVLSGKASVSSSGNGIIGMSMTNTSAGSTAMAYGYGFYSNNVVNSTGGITSSFGHYSLLTCTSTNTVGSHYGFYADAPNISGTNTVTNIYGLYVASQNTATTTNSWGVYCAGASDISYIAGKLGVGTSSPSSSTLAMVASPTLASSASLVWNGAHFASSTLTLAGSTNVTTSTGLNFVKIFSPTITSGSAITVTNAATLAITAAPIAGGSTTITNAYSLWVQAGKVRLDGGFQLTTSPTNNYVLTCDASGNGTWQAASGGGGGASLSTPNTWSALQTFGNNISIGGGTFSISGLGASQVLAYNGSNWVNAAASGFVVTLLSNSDGSITFSASVGAITASLNMAQVNAWTGQQYFAQATLTDASSIVWNLNTQQASIVTLGGNRTLANPTNKQAGSSYTLIVKQDGTGSRTLAYGTNYKWAGGVAPVLSTAANAVDILTFISDGSLMYGTYNKSFS